jgi:uncharacterized protein YbaR (Trm112 family)
VLPPELLEVLVCPKSKQPLVYFPHGTNDSGDGDESGGFLLCPTSRLRYPVRDGVPVMLIEEATDVPAAQLEVLISHARRLGLNAI